MQLAHPRHVAAEPVPPDVQRAIVAPESGRIRSRVRLNETSATPRRKRPRRKTRRPPAPTPHCPANTSTSGLDEPGSCASPRRARWRSHAPRDERGNALTFRCPRPRRAPASRQITDVANRLPREDRDETCRTARRPCRSSEPATVVGHRALTVLARGMCSTSSLSGRAPGWWCRDREP